MKTIEQLMSPLTIRSMEIANRVVMPPMGTAVGNDDSTVSEANLAYMKRRARSGAGFYITEIVEVHPLGAASPRCMGVWDDRFIPGLSKPADLVPAQKGKIAMQLHHAGRESFYQLSQGKAPVQYLCGQDRRGLRNHQYGRRRAEARIEPIEQVIVAVGVTPRDDLKNLLDLKGILHYVIGDTYEPRRIIEATSQGAKAAWDIS